MRDIDPRSGPYTAALAEGTRKMVTVGVCEQHEETEMGYTMPAMSEALRAVERAREVAGRLATALAERT